VREYKSLSLLSLAGPRRSSPSRIAAHSILRNTRAIITAHPAIVSSGEPHVDERASTLCDIRTPGFIHLSGTDGAPPNLQLPGFIQKCGQASSSPARSVLETAYRHDL